jgi:hypothetical protein
MEKLASTIEMWKRQEFGYDPLFIVQGYRLEEELDWECEALDRHWELADWTFDSGDSGD